MTPFLDAHPGGAGRIEMVDGFDLGKFWAVYRLHDRPHIRQLLTEYLIGSLSPEDMAKVSEETVFEDMYSADPQRDKSKLRIPSEHPWNSEPASLRTLVDTFFTPNDVFFVRNHNPVPVLDEETWRLEIGANPENGIMKDYSFSLQELKTLFKKHRVVATLQCAGNRQEDYVSESRPLYVAPHWRNGAIGCALWGGVRVRDVLGYCGMDVDGISAGRTLLKNAKIVNFIAEDADETGVNYAGVIPIEKALDPLGDAILAYEMNGVTLPRDHGWPVRLLAPGHAGCRNVKWVGRIEVAERPSELDAGSRLDRHFGPEVSWGMHKAHAASERCPEKESNMECKLRLDQGPVIQTLPVQSIICLPEERSRICGKGDTIEVKGVAWSGGGRGICRVEISIDGGKNWYAADLTDRPKCQGCPPEMGMGRNWAWRHFNLNLPLPDPLKEVLEQKKVVEIELCAKAIDGDFNSQPMEMSHSWNVLGVCVNHWHRVRVTLDPSLETGQIVPAPGPPAPGSPYWSDGMCHKCGSFVCQPSQWRHKTGQKWP
uniref:Cytochrome b5 heme-binding domain-containing protein n=1 Tax=Paramoeba aestuarina TaxID=180227 RepID=A0A7S4L5J1_9EUKA